jgi:UDP-2,3-diacylglucosamine pyrophosphatase LpxH
MDLKQAVINFLTSKPGYSKTKNSTIAEKLNCDEEIVKEAKKELIKNETLLKSNNIKEVWVKDKTTSIRYVSKPAEEKSKQEFQSNFIDFLKEYKPKTEQLSNSLLVAEGCLLIDIQDPHYNKLDEEGSNNLEERFNKIYKALHTVLEQSSKGNILDKVVYVIGSDHFNSEWTNLTTKGTPQQNMVGFHEGFSKICDNEVNLIELIRKYTKEVEVVFIPGNHDQFISWHMVHWLQAYFKDCQIDFDINPSFTKCFKYGNSGIMLNHGDAMKPEKLAGIFPQVFRKEWSNCDHQYIFIGDRHHILAKDINGIQFYQLPALSTAKSNWDLKQGYQVTKSELQAFFISKDSGVKTIYKEKI